MQTEHESEADVGISRDIDIASKDFPEVKIVDTESLSCCSVSYCVDAVLFTCDMVYVTGRRGRGISGTQS